MKVDLDISDESKCTGKPLTRLLNLFKRAKSEGTKYAKINFRFVQIDVLLLYAHSMGIELDIVESNDDVALIKISPK